MSCFLLVLAMVRKNASMKLSDEVIGEIRASKEGVDVVAARFGISRVSVWRIKAYGAYSESSVKMRERSEAIFRYAKRRRFLRDVNEVRADDVLAEGVFFEVDDFYDRRKMLKRLLAEEVLHHVEKRSFYCRVGTSDLKSVQEAATSYKYLCRGLCEHPVVVVDAGANIGGFSVWMADRLDMQEVVFKIFAYEPVADHHVLAKRNVHFNGFGRNIDLRRTALGAKAGRAVIYRPRKHSQKYRDSMVAPVVRDYKVERIHVLDVKKEFVKWAEQSDGGSLLVKIDTEGFEMIICKRLVQVYQAGDRSFGMRVVLEFSHDIHKDFSVFREFIDFLECVGVTELSFNKSFYQASGSFKPQCGSSASIVKFALGF